MRHASNLSNASVVRAPCGAALDMLVARTPRAHLGGNNYTVKCVVFGSFLWYLADLYKIWYPGVIFGADFKNFVKFEKNYWTRPFWAHFGPFLQYLTNFHEIWYSESEVIFGADLKNFIHFAKLVKISTCELRNIIIF